MIIDYVINDKKINDMISKLVSHYYLDDFKSHFYLQLLEMDIKKLKKAYIKKYINLLCYRVIRNQYLSKSSSFWKIYRNNGFYKEVRVEDNDLTYLSLESNNDSVVGIIEEQELNNIEKIDLLINELNLNKESEVIEDIIRQINEWLNHRHYYHSELFKMYYFEGMTYKAIEEKTGIYYQTVSYSVKKTLVWIKDKIIV